MWTQQQTATSKTTEGRNG